MLQEIQDYKLNWLRSRSFRVRLNEADEQCLNWLKENLDEKIWDVSVNPENSVHTFFFENAQDAEKFREAFQGDSRTVDIN